MDGWGGMEAGREVKDQPQPHVKCVTDIWTAPALFLLSHSTDSLAFICYTRTAFVSHEPFYCRLSITSCLFCSARFFIFFCPVWCGELFSHALGAPIFFQRTPLNISYESFQNCLTALHCLSRGCTDFVYHQASTCFSPKEL